MTSAQPSRAFFRNAILDTVVPEASNSKLPEALDEASETGTDDDTSLLSIRQRDRLFFGKYSLTMLRTIVSYSFADVQMNG